MQIAEPNRELAHRHRDPDQTCPPAQTMSKGDMSALPGIGLSRYHTGSWVGADMKRRDFIALLGSAAACPFAAGARQSTIPTIGYLHSASAEAVADETAAFRRGLEEAGYVEGRNVVIEYRWAEGRFRATTRRNHRCNRWRCHRAGGKGRYSDNPNRLYEWQ